MNSKAETLNTGKWKAVLNVLQSVFFAVFVLAYLYLTVANVMQKVTGNSYVSLAFSLLLELAGILAVLITALTFITGKRSRSELLLLICKAVILLLVISAHTSSHLGDMVYALLVFTVGSTGQKEGKLLNTAFSIGAAVIVVAFFLSMTGIIENNRNNSFGFSYRTHYACFLLCMTLVFAIIRNGRFRWYEELGLAALLIFDLLLIKGKTCFICLLILMSGSFWRHYKTVGGIPFQNRKCYGYVLPVLFRILYFPFVLLDHLVHRKKKEKSSQDKLFSALLWAMKYSYILFASLYFFLTVSYRALLPFWNVIPGLSTFKSRLLLSTIAFEEFPISLWGNTIHQAGLSYTESAVTFYFALDSAYVKILLQFGLIPFLLIIGLLTCAEIRLVAKKRYYAAFALSIFALDSTMEYWMYSLSYNLFILLSFCELKEDALIAEYKTHLLLSEKDSQSSSARRLALAALICAFSLWSLTAYRVTKWRGWTPDYDATIVVPGNYIDSVKSDSLTEERLKWAGSYLRSHEDAICIAGGEEMRQRLIAVGISPERLLVDDSSDSVEEMLLAADGMIRENGLPKRLTVCTYPMQQARVQRQADELHIPVNSLTMNMPWNMYMQNFAAEQWKVLWNE